MIVTDPAAFVAAYSAHAFPPRHPATARSAFLVRPASAELAAESAKDNRYMDLAQMFDPARARAQHAELARRLAEDVPIVTFEGHPDSPDDMFPNNVFATAPGRLIVGRMRHSVRQRECDRGDIRGFFHDTLRYEIADLSREPFVAELTGALVIDHARGIGYCGLSERCDLDGARAMHDAFGLRLMFCFELAEGEYHANVVLALLAGRVALIAADGFRDPAVPHAIAEACHGNVIWLDTAQKNAFCANAITLSSERVWMSDHAAHALTPVELAALEQSGFALGSVEIDEIEKAGGSLRCCVAEIF